MISSRRKVFNHYLNHIEGVLNDRQYDQLVDAREVCTTLTEVYDCVTNCDHKWWEIINMGAFFCLTLLCCINLCMYVYVHVTDHMSRSMCVAKSVRKKRSMLLYPVWVCISDGEWLWFNGREREYSMSSLLMPLPILLYRIFKCK